MIANVCAIGALWSICLCWPLFFSFLYGEFLFFVAVRTMPGVTAALAARLMVSYFFSLARFVILCDLLWFCSSCSACFGFFWIPYGRKKRVRWIVELLLLYGLDSKGVNVGFHYFHVFFNKP